MRRLTLAPTLLVILNCMGQPQPPPPAEKPEPATIPQAKPFLELLRAVAANDGNAFRSCYSDRIRNDEVQSEWPQNLAEARETIQTAFPRYSESDFSYSFDGTAEKGEVAIVFRGEPWAEIRVILEGNRWVLDER